MGEDLGEGRGEKVGKEREGKKREKEKGGNRREETGKEERSERKGEGRRKMKEGNILSLLWPFHPHQICHCKEVGCLLVVEPHQLPPDWAPQMWLPLALLRNHLWDTEELYWGSFYLHLVRWSPSHMADTCRKCAVIISCLWF